MRAYSELYLDDAMSTLGEMCDHAVNRYRMDQDEMFVRFAVSRPGAEFGRGNARYTAGMSGLDLLREVMLETGGEEPVYSADTYCSMDRSRQYWAGWAYAYYQWKTGFPFIRLLSAGLSFSRVVGMYRYHEADLSVFESAADAVFAGNAAGESALRRLRAYAGITQKQLSTESGVALRMIQLYEQGQNDIRKAQAETVQALACALHCDMGVLLESDREQLLKKD